MPYFSFIHCILVMFTSYNKYFHSYAIKWIMVIWKKLHKNTKICLFGIRMTSSLRLPSVLMDMTRYPFPEAHECWSLDGACVWLMDTGSKRVELMEHVIDWWIHVRREWSLFITSSQTNHSTVLFQAVGYCCVFYYYYYYFYQLYTITATPSPQHAIIFGKDRHI